MRRQIPAAVRRWGRGYEMTPDDDPVHLYADSLVGILPDRRLSGVAIFPCVGGRDPVSAAAVAAAFERGDGADMSRLHRRRPEQGRLIGPDWGLS